MIVLSLMIILVLILMNVNYANTQDNKNSEKISIDKHLKISLNSFNISNYTYNILYYSMFSQDLTLFYYLFLSFLM